MMRSNGVPSDKDLHFKLGDVVLCRYSSYPYWPATVDQTHQPEYRGKHFAMLRTRGGELVPCFWCTFSNEDTGGWVRADRMVLFHPDILSKVRVDKGSEWHEDQKDAIESALKSYKEVFKSQPQEAPQLPPDLAKGRHNGKWDATDEDDIASDDEAHPEPAEEDEEDPMDLGDSDEDERPSKRQGRPAKAEKTPARPKAKKEPRKTPKRKSPPAEETRPKKRSKTASKPEKELLDNVDNDPEEPRRKGRDKDVEEEGVEKSAGKRRRHSYAQANEPSKKLRKMENELANAKETIASLRRALKKREKALAELTGDGAGVACVMPPMAPPVEQALPPREKYRSNPADSETFNSMMDTLVEDYDSFKKCADAADQARMELEKTMEHIKKIYHEACEKVSAAEAKATEKERDVVRDLRGILQADVEVNNLRERKAGHVVRAMFKKCKDLPAIREHCDAIYKSWKVQVMEYMKDNEEKIKQESPKGVKSTGGKDEGKSSESPPKKKAKEEDATDSPKGKGGRPNEKAEGKDIEMNEAKSEDTKEDGENAPLNETKEGKETARSNETKEAKSEDKKEEGETTPPQHKRDIKEEKQKAPDEKPESRAKGEDLSEKAEKGDASEKVDKPETPQKGSPDEPEKNSVKANDAKREDGSTKEAPDTGAAQKP